MFAVGSLGTLLASPVIGALARYRNVQYALRVPILIGLLLVLATLVLALTSRNL